MSVIGELAPYAPEAAADDASPAVPLPVVVYTPESALCRPGQLMRDMVRDLFASRELAWRLFVRDVRAQYRQSMLGYVWLLLPPIASMLMFTFLQSQRILNVGPTDIPYPAFVLTGTVLWEAFTASVWAPMNAVGGAAAMITKLNFPREALLLTAIYHVVFNTVIRLALLVPAFVYFGVAVDASLLLSPLGILAVVLVGFSTGLLLVPLGLLYQDVGRGLGMALGAWFLITPVIYPPPTAWPATLVNTLNPISPLLITARELLTCRPLTHAAPCMVISAAALVCLLVGWVVYRLAMPHLVARMSA